MNSLYVDIAATDGGSFKVYLTSSDAENAPGLVLMQYICGVNAVMRSLAEDFAAKGFLVAVPDLFWRQEPGIELLNDPYDAVRYIGARSLRSITDFPLQDYDHLAGESQRKLIQGRLIEYWNNNADAVERTTRSRLLIEDGQITSGDWDALRSLRDESPIFLDE